MKRLSLFIVLWLLLSACYTNTPTPPRKTTFADDPSVFQGSWSGEAIGTSELATIKFSDLSVACPDNAKECERYEFQGLVELNEEAAVPVSGIGDGSNVIYVQTSPVSESIQGSFALNGEEWTFSGEFVGAVDNVRNKSYVIRLRRETSEDDYFFEVEAD